MVPLCVQPEWIHHSPYLTRHELALDRTSHDHTIVLPHNLFDLHSPAIAFHVSAIADLTARLSVEWVMLEL